MAITIYPDTGYDSFCSVADADTVLSNNVISSSLTAWNALADGDKEIYLRQATLLIKNKITLPSTLEDNLKYACAFLANYSIGKDMTNDDGKKSNLKSKKVDGIVEKEYFSPNPSDNSFPDIVETLLADYGVVSDGAFSFVRS